MRWRPLLLPAVSGVLAAGVSLRRIDDPDYWTHLAMGRQFWRAGVPSVVDSVSRALEGQRLDTSEAPFQVLLLGLRAAVSDSGVCVAVAVLAGLAVGLLASLAPREGTIRICAAGLLLTAIATAARFRFVPRPELFAYVLFGAALLLVRSWSRGPRLRTLFLTGAVLALWSVVHLTWTLGATFVGLILLLNARFDFWRTLRRERPAVFAAVAAGGLVVAAVAFLKVGRFALLVLSNLGTGGVLGGVTEMRPLWEFPGLAARVGLAAVLALALAWGAAEGRWRRLAAWLFAALVAAVAVRNAAFGVLAMSLPALEGLSSFSARRVGRRLARAALASTVAASALLAATTIDSTSGVGVNWHLFPREAAQLVKALRPAAKVFNTWDCGGYLGFAWDGAPRTFMDGRLGPRQLMDDHDAIADATAAEEKLAEHGIQTVLLQPFFRSSGRILPGVFWFLSRPEWVLVSASDALVLVRRDLAAGAPQLSRSDGWRFVLREADLTALDGQPQPHLAFSRAVALFHLGQLEEARAALREATARRPSLAGFYREYAQALGLR